MTHRKRDEILDLFTYYDDMYKKSEFSPRLTVLYKSGKSRILILRYCIQTGINWLNYGQSI